MSNLGFTDIAENANDPEAAANDALNRIDLALTETLEKDAGSGNVSVSLSEIQQAIAILAKNHSIARDLSLPQCKRVIFIRNNGSAALSVKRGTTTIVVPATSNAVVRLNGTANGLFDLSTGSTSGGSLPAGGTTGQVLTKQSNADGDADWEDASGGGGSGGGIVGIPTQTGEIRTIDVPLLSEYTQTAIGGTTIKQIDDVGVSICQKGLGTSNKFARLSRTVPSGAFEAIAGVRGAMYGDGFPSFGIGLRESSGNKMVTAEVIIDDNGRVRMQSNQFNGENFNSPLVNKSGHMFEDTIFFKLKFKTGNYVDTEISPDGVDWYVINTDSFYVGAVTHFDFFAKVEGASSIFVKALMFHQEFVT